MNKSPAAGIRTLFLTFGICISGPALGAVPEQFGGPSSISGQLNYSDELRAAEAEAAAPDLGADSWFEWKGRLQEEHDLSFGLYGYWLYQNANDTLAEEDEGLGQIYRFLGSYNAFGKDTGHPGRIEWRFEHRSNMGSYLSPSQLGGETGAAALDSGFAYSPAFDTDLAVLNWTQLFNQKKAGFAVGRLAFDAYLDAFPFQTFSRGFINRAFILSPAMATTGIGALGTVAKGFVNDNVWLGGQIYDGNAVSGDFNMDTFDQGEWLKAVEIGWTPSFERRTTDRIQFTWWDKDAREQAGIAAGQGWTVSASMKRDKWFPFFRFGHSDGGAGVAAKEAASLGFEYTTLPTQAWSLGLGWANPTASDKRDEYVVETSYKFQLLKGFSLLPNVQLLLDPANNPEQDQVWVFGLRGILAI
jgi:porin